VQSMVKPVLLVTRRLPPAVEARAARDYDARLNPEDVPRNGADIVRLAEGAAAILCCPAERLDGAAIMALSDTVRVIATYSVGYDHVAVEAAAARGIIVCNTPGVLSVATAETVMLLILAASRRAGEGERLIRSGQWQGWAPTQLMGTQVSGKRLGIFGMGRIGREVVRMARAFDMEVHYRDQARLPAELEQGARFHGTDESFLPQCQVLSLNAPGGGSTHHWLNSERIALLPRGAVVVNAARGTLVDDAALIAALHTGQVGYAGLDVYEGEPMVSPGYLGLDNVVLLPHLGSATVETRDAMGFLALDAIDAVMAGRTPPNAIG
jgi:lactate dehydrogenase-like 2-hydroxyacid dehydrogenase